MVHIRARLSLHVDYLVGIMCCGERCFKLLTIHKQLVHCVKEGCLFERTDDKRGTNRKPPRRSLGQLQVFQAEPPVGFGGIRGPPSNERLTVMLPKFLAGLSLPCPTA